MPAVMVSGAETLEMMALVGRARARRGRKEENCILRFLLFFGLVGF